MITPRSELYPTSFPLPQPFPFNKRFECVMVMLMEDDDDSYKVYDANGVEIPLNNRSLSEKINYYCRMMKGGD